MDAKQCTKCGQHKPHSCFSKCSGSADGLQRRCKQCCASAKKDWSAKNKLHVSSYNAKYKADNRDSVSEYNAKRYAEAAQAEIARVKGYQSKNKDRIKAMRKQYRIANAAKIAARNAERIALKRLAMPPCLSEADIEAARLVYLFSTAWSKATGIQHDVDHIVPLRGKEVSGLHVPWNLRIIPHEINIKKGNRLDPDITML
jgi:hypothetical protein